jgi:hypothetical protein
MYRLDLRVAMALVRATLVGNSPVRTEPLKRDAHPQSAKKYRVDPTSIPGARTVRLFQGV